MREGIDERDVANFLLHPVNLARQKRGADGQEPRPHERREERRRGVEGN